MRNLLVALLLVASAGVLAETEVVWFDGTKLPIEGRAFAETVGGPYGRLPCKFADRATEADRLHGADSCGVTLRFKTDSSKLRFRWSLANSDRFAHDRYMTQMAMGGIDVYEETERGCRLRLDADSRGGPNLENPDAATELTVPWTPGRTAVVYLPVRGVVKSLSVGLDKGAKWEPSPHAKGNFKPVVVYGTSLIHGGCVSRPGLVFTTQAARRLDIPFVNLGFSGSGRMESVMCDVVAEAEASVYVLECLGNLEFDELVSRFEPFVRRLRKMRPEVPILICENFDVRQVKWRTHIRSVYDRLKAEDSHTWQNLHYLPIRKMMPDDPDLTLDQCHPNDAGAYFMGQAYAEAIARVLGISIGSSAR